MSLLCCRDQPCSPETATKSGQATISAATVFASETGQDDLCLMIQHWGFVDLGKTKPTPQERRSSELPRAATSLPKFGRRWAAAAAVYFANREAFPVEFGDAATWVL